MSSYNSSQVSACSWSDVGDVQSSQCPLITLLPSDRPWSHHLEQSPWRPSHHPWRHHPEQSADPFVVSLAWCCTMFLPGMCTDSSCFEDWIHILTTAWELGLRSGSLWQWIVPVCSFSSRDWQTPRQLVCTNSDLMGQQSGRSVLQPAHRS